MTKPDLCIIGPMTGAHPNRVPTQGERLAQLFSGEGYKVACSSTSLNRYLRLLQILYTVMHCRGSIQVLQVFGGRSIVVEDLASWFGKRNRQKIVMILRGGSIPHFIDRYPTWARRVFNRADAIVTPSHYLARTMAHHGFRCSIIPNVIDMSIYPFRCRTQLAPRLLWMRSFYPPIYNPAMAVRVFAGLKKKVPESTLVMAGQYDPALRNIERMAVELSVQSAVRFAGFLDTAKKIIEGQAADIFINTNYIDNMPVSVLEAFAFGLPVVATSVGGIPDLITHNENGLLVPVDDDGSMIEEILRLIGTPGLARRLSENGRKCVEKCSWAMVRPQFEEIFRKLSGLMN